MSPLEVRIGLVRHKTQQGYSKIGEVGCYELLLALTVASVWEVASLSLWPRRK